MAKDSGDYKRPLNSFVSSDDAYWYLREVEHLLEVPRCAPSRLERVSLAGVGGAPLPVADMALLQLERERLVVLEAGGRWLHLYSAPDLQPAGRIELQEPIARIAASSKGLWLLGLNRTTVHRVQLSALIGDIGTGAGQDGPVDLARLPLGTLKLPADLCGREDLLMVATPTLGPEAPERLLVCTPDLSRVHAVLAGDASLHGQPLELAGPKRVLLAPHITAACGSADGSVLLFNERTGQVLSFLPSSSRPTLRVVAGDGVAAKGPVAHFAPSLEARLRPTASLCEFRVSGRILAELSDFARFSPHPDYVGSVAKVGSPSPKAIAPKIRAMLEQGAVLVAYDRETGGLTTISAPVATAALRRLADAAPPRVMPLRTEGGPLPRTWQISAGQPPAAPGPTAGWDHCAPGPESSLLLWRKGSSELLRYAIDFSAFDALRRDVDHMQDLNTRVGQVSRMSQFEDS